MSLHDDLNNKNLFDENKPGEYQYSEGQYGKTAQGQLVLQKGERNLYAQRQAGGNDRLVNDDGGHLIGTRFNGSGKLENIDAQNSNLNRGSYKAYENQLAEQVENGDKVFLHVDTFKSNDSERPDAYMGYAVSESQDGSRSWDAFSYTNASSNEMQEWNDLMTETDYESDDDNNAMDYPDDYDSGDYDEME